jgi:hypothetical protein
MNKKAHRLTRPSRNCPEKPSHRFSTSQGTGTGLSQQSIRSYFVEPLGAGNRSAYIASGSVAHGQAYQEGLKSHVDRLMSTINQR